MKEYDVICIGAGVSGLYLGYRMARDNPEKSLLILEKMDRIGGKIVSVPMSGNVPYNAEGCAQRFTEDQETVQSLLRRYNIGSTEIPTISYSTSDSDLLGEIRNIYEDKPNLHSISNLDAIVNTPDIQNGNYDNLKIVTELLGYTNETYLKNVQTFIESVSNVIHSRQFYPDGGFTRLIEALAHEVSQKYDIRIKSEVLTIDRLDNGMFLVKTRNSQYLCKHVVFTGNRHQLNLIGGNSMDIRELKDKLYEYTGVDKTYIRMFMEISDPWWNRDEIGTVMKTDGPLNSLHIMSDNTLCVYCDQKNAELLYYLVPQELRHLGVDTINWIPSVLMKRLNDFLSKHVYQLYQDLVNKPPTSPGEVRINRIAFKYTKQAVLNYAPLPVPIEQFTEQLNNFRNIHLISDSYYYRQGWIQYCLDCVDDSYSSIIS
jgi:hypothetical protein